MASILLAVQHKKQEVGESVLSRQNTQHINLTELIQASRSECSNGSATGNMPGWLCIARLVLKGL